MRAYPGLFDIRCGEDAYDTAQAYRHPVSGAFTPDDFAVSFATGFPNQIVPMGIRGGAATDVNNLGLWLYGAYAKGRLASIPGYGQWGTYVAHYPLIPKSTDTVTITARIVDEAVTGQTVNLHYRVDKTGTPNAFAVMAMMGRVRKRGFCRTARMVW